MGDLAPFSGQKLRQGSASRWLRNDTGMSTPIHNMKKVRIFDKKVTKIRVSEIRVSEVRVSEIRISSNHRELHGAIFCACVCTCG